jgi:hypothetical protein
MIPIQEELEISGFILSPTTGTDGLQTKVPTRKNTWSAHSTETCVGLQKGGDEKVHVAVTKHTLDTYKNTAKRFLF